MNSTLTHSLKETEDFERKKRRWEVFHMNKELLEVKVSEHILMQRELLLIY